MEAESSTLEESRNEASEEGAPHGLSTETFQEEYLGPCATLIFCPPRSRIESQKFGLTRVSLDQQVPWYFP